MWLAWSRTGVGHCPAVPWSSRVLVQASARVRVVVAPKMAGCPRLISLSPLVLTDGVRWPIPTTLHLSRFATQLSPALPCPPRLRRPHRATVCPAALGAGVGARRSTASHGPVLAPADARRSLRDAGSPVEDTTVAPESGASPARSPETRAEAIGGTAGPALAAPALLVAAGPALAAPAVLCSRLVFRRPSAVGVGR